MTSISATTFIFFFSLIILIATLCFGGCIESEKNALLQFKNGLFDPSNRLADWVVDGSDCCKWTGVVCHNITAHVLELNLKTRSQQEYLSGKVSSSLLELKHLSNLDLSINDFGGIPIPIFLGSLQSLRYLSLSDAGFGGTIPPHLGNLSNLQYLNLGYLSVNVEKLDWVSSLSSLEFLDMSYLDLTRSFNWLEAINSLPSLLELHLSNCQLTVFNPTHLPVLNLSSLVVLDLSLNDFEGPIPNVLQNMTSSFLRELDLSLNNFNSSIPNWFYDLTHLKLLNLGYNELQGQISSDIGNLISLVNLDVSYNYELEFETGILNSLANLCSLRSLHLSYNNLNQTMNDILEILSSGCVLDRLQSLSLGPLSGYSSEPIPSSFKHFCNLISLDFFDVKLNQEINDVLAVLTGCVSNVLELLKLVNCQLSGHLTDDLSYFRNLITFDISDNSISGPIPLSLGEMNSLTYLDLSGNRFNGTPPVSLGNLKQLETVYISNNELEGEVSHLHFANLTRLSYFEACDNNIVLRVSSNWIPPLQLQSLCLRSCQIGPQFPEWLGLLKYLTYLDLSNSGISTPIPAWFWDSFSKYDFLNFSHNQIHGSIPNTPFAIGYMMVIDLSSNNFSGPVPNVFSNAIALDLSTNSFSGSILNFLCYKMNEVQPMQVLNLDRNLLNGEIPDCWRSWENLATVKLSNNKFGGNIPNSIGTLSFLESLNLRNNNLSGVIPSSIQNCKKLAILDLSENNLVGSIPTWIGYRFADLTILSLYANKFHNHIPKELCGLVSLHILDLARNNFSGTIPSCFNKFTSMVTRNDSSGLFYASKNLGMFIESILLVMKGKVIKYSTNLRFVRSIDLSSNNLYGEIPIEIMSITGLLSLNLSQNALTGRIPNNIGDMKWLEAIDFSQNNLCGEIPNSMSTLTFLGTLNLSYNNLSGRIPSGTQLQSFDSSSFMGNHLCGLPLINNCSSDNDSPSNEEKDENGDEVDVWFYASIVFGFVFGFWSVVGSLAFMRRWKHFYFNYHLGEKF